MEIHHLFKLFLCKMILGKGAFTSSSRHVCKSVLLPFWRQSPTKADNRQTSKSIGNWAIYNPVPHQSWKDENRVPSSFSCYLFSWFWKIICIHMYIYICKWYVNIYIYGSPPPQGPPEREGMYHLPSAVLNTFKDMLRKHCKFQCFMHILLVLFWWFYSLIR